MDFIKRYFSSEAVVDHYFRAAVNVGLWESERVLFQKCFESGDRMLELGCGAGRITFGLEALGYKDVVGVDIAEGMIASARESALALERNIGFEVGDAKKLRFEDKSFDGVIFGFNGLMQIPGAENRKKALAEIFRVLKPGKFFIFTTLDRQITTYPFKGSWEDEAIRWSKGEEPADLFDFGDVRIETKEGSHFMHVPSVEEVKEVLLGVGFKEVETFLRDDRFSERKEVLSFADNCRFWVFQKED